MSPKSSYPKLYENEEKLFTEFNTLMELPCYPPEDPGPARAIYDDNTGDVKGGYCAPHKTRSIFDQRMRNRGFRRPGSE